MSGYGRRSAPSIEQNPPPIQDTNMIDKLLAASYGNSVTTWANSLAKRIKVMSSCIPRVGSLTYLNGNIKTGSYKSSAPSWISCSSTTEPAFNARDIADDIQGLLHRRAITPLECPLVWAQDSNKYCCVGLSCFGSVEVTPSLVTAFDNF